jgi:hypothetical protein
MTTLRHKYHAQRIAANFRNIDWHFTYETWLEWWGDDIIHRGRGKGKLCMARYQDQGPYHPDNVRKLTAEENSMEAHKDKPKFDNNKTLNSILITCPHCNVESNRGNAKRWHFDNCKKGT